VLTAVLRLDHPCVVVRLQLATSMANIMDRQYTAERSRGAPSLQLQVGLCSLMGRVGDTSASCSDARAPVCGPVVCQALIACAAAIKSFVAHVEKPLSTCASTFVFVSSVSPALSRAPSPRLCPRVRVGLVTELLRPCVVLRSDGERQLVARGAVSRRQDVLLQLDHQGRDVGKARRAGWHRARHQGSCAVLALVITSAHIDRERVCNRVQSIRFVTTSTHIDVVKAGATMVVTKPLTVRVGDT
jgi:hypothetical protein